MISESFVGGVRGGKDVVFCRARVLNQSSTRRSVHLCVAIRPFGVEGVAPIRNIELETRRIVSVDGVVGVVFAEEPSIIKFGSANRGDTARTFAQNPSDGREDKISCARGLANAVAMFGMTVDPSAERSICYSMALGTKAELKAIPVKRTWRVSFEKRREEQGASWERELEGSLKMDFGDDAIQRLFVACRTTLLQLQDGDFISPGPYLYHHFWFRDAAPMLKALDVLGFARRVRQVIERVSEATYLRRLLSSTWRRVGLEWCCALDRL